MLSPRIKRTDPDKIFAVVKNDESATTLVDGDVVIWQTAASKNYGVDILKSTAASVLAAGVISGPDIAIGDYGLMQVYGYHGNVKGTGTLAAAATCTSAATGQVTDGAAADDPSLRMGVVLKALAGGRVGMMINRL